MTQVRWRQQYDGDWVRWPLSRRKAIGCCDCGLVHWFTTKITPTGRIYFSADRDDELTTSVRKKRGFAVTRLHIYKDKKNEWRWTLFAGNGKILADSGEGYKRRSRCRAIALRIFPWFNSGVGKVQVGN